MGKAFTFALVTVAIIACSAPTVRTPIEELENFPLIDVHSHFSSAANLDDFFQASKDAGISRMVLMGGEAAARAAQQQDNRFIASYRPGGIGDDRRRSEQFRYGSSLESVKQISAEVEQALRSGLYRGLGEIPTYHAGYTAQISPDSPLILRLLDLAGSAGVPINIHCSDSGLREMDRALGASRKTVVIWAHAGSHLSPNVIKSFLRDHSNLYFDLSAKHPPWTSRRNFRHGILIDSSILEDWRDLFEVFPDRFLLGFDLGVSAQTTPFSFAGNVGLFFRTLLSQLTPATARKIGSQNADRIYKFK